MKRRSFLKNSTLSAFSIAAFGGISWNGKNFEGDTITTSDILGPFYRPGSPMRSNLIPPNSKGEILHLSGTIYQKDGKTPIENALIESWQCDEKEKYDNASDEYLYRGAIKTGLDGKYAFTTIVPVPYKDGEDWRPAHIHLRISSKNHQDLITQVYLKGDSHIAKDASANAPESASRILPIEKNKAGEKTVVFNISLGNTMKLDDAGYKKITGIYRLKNGLAEFSKQDDLLFLKMNGQYMEGMAFKGNNSFEGGMGFNKVRFELLPEGAVKMTMTLWDFGPADQRFFEYHEGLKTLKYNE